MITDYQWEDRDRLYYDRWEWSFNFRLEGIWTTRALDHDHLDRRAHAPYSRTNGEQVLNLHHWIDFLRARTEPHKRCISYNYVYFYTNSTTLIADIRVLPYINHVSVARARVTLPRDVIVMKNPRNRYRSYLREKSVNRENVMNLRQYLDNNDHLRVSQGLVSSLDWMEQYPTQNSWWSRRYHFVDHDDPRDLLFLQMIVPNIIRCTLPIQQIADK